MSRLTQFVERWHVQETVVLPADRALHMDVPSVHFFGYLTNAHLRGNRTTLLQDAQLQRTACPEIVVVSGRIRGESRCDVDIRQYVFQTPDGHLHSVLLAHRGALASWSPFDFVPQRARRAWMDMFRIQDAVCYHANVDFAALDPDASPALAGLAQSLLTLLTCEDARFARFSPSTLRYGVNFHGQAILPPCPTRPLLQAYLDTQADGGASALKTLLDAWETPREVSGWIGLKGGVSIFSLCVPTQWAWTPFANGTVRVTVDALTLTAKGLDRDDGVPTTIGFALSGKVHFFESRQMPATDDGSASANASPEIAHFVYTLALDDSGTRLRLEIRVPHNADGAWIKALGIPDLACVVGRDVIPTVRYLELVLPLNGTTPSLCAVLTWPKWTLLQSSDTPPIALIEFAPTLLIETGFVQGTTALTLQGALTFYQHGVYDVRASYPSGAFGACLRADSHIDLRLAFGGLLAGLLGEGDQATVMLLDLEGNLRDHEFFFHVVIAGQLSFSLAQERLVISQIDLSASYASGKWSGALSAALTIADIDLAVSVDLSCDDGCHVACIAPSMTLDQLAQAVLGHAAPEALHHVTLENACLEFSVGQQNTLHVSTTTTGEIDLGHMQLGIDHLDIAYRGGLSLEGHAHFRYVDAALAPEHQPRMDLTLRYDQGQGSIIGCVEHLSWSLSGMARALTHSFSLPIDPRSDARINRVDLAYDFGPGRQRFAMQLSVSWGERSARDTTVWSMVAQRANGSSSWQAMMYVDLPPLDFYALPYVGKALRAIVEKGTVASPAPVGSTASSRPPGLEEIAVGIGAKVDATAAACLRDGLAFGAAFPDIDLSAGYGVRADLVLPNARRTLLYPRQAAPSGTAPSADKMSTGGVMPPARPADTGQPAIAGSTVVGRSFGPVTISQIHSTASKEGITLRLDATAKLGPLECTLLGLIAASPLTWPPAPHFDLEGLSVACTTDTLTLAGGLQKKKTPEGERYAGQLIAKFGKFSLTAIAIYDEKPHPSFGVFMVFSGPLGGPPAFFITGLAGGVGHHRALQPPRINDIASHIFIKALSGDADTQAIAQLETVSPPAPDQHWIALGIRFTSFNLIDSVAILTLSLGSATRVNLLGRSTLELPPVSLLKAGTKKSDPVARIELALLADFHPSAGEFVLLGQLTPRSFLFHPDARLGGGFAFALWFGKHPNAGDFVLTVGGYHPRFVVPAHYPKVAPISLNWQVTPQLSIKGERYFAVTPSALMLGGTLSITWQSNSIRAWLDFESHLLIQFQPFAFEAVVQVSVGVAVNLHTWLGTYAFSVTVGASLVVSGPPFHGVCRISAAGLSFEIAFGEQGQPAPRVVDWCTLRRTLLPAANRREHDALASSQLTTAAMFGATPGVTTHTDSLIGVTAVSGLLDSLVRPVGGLGDAAQTPVWIVSPADFVVEIACVVPLSSMALDGALEPNITANAFGVKPMGVAAGALQSQLCVTYEGSASWHILPIHSNVPTGLWGDPTSDALGASMVPDVLSGMMLRPQRHHGESSGTRVALQKDKQPINAGIDASTRKAQWVRTTSPVITAPADAIARMQSSCHAREVCQARSNVIAALNALASDTGQSTTMLHEKGRSAIVRRPFDMPEQFEHFAQALPTLLSDAPKFVSWVTTASSSPSP